MDESFSLIKQIKIIRNFKTVCQSYLSFNDVQNSTHNNNLAATSK